MNLGRINKYKNPLSELNTANALYYTIEHIDGSIEYIYHVNLIYLLNNVFSNLSYNYVSTEQEKLIKQFIKEAEKVTTSSDYSTMSENIKQLDEFLGGYIGENNGKYSR